MNSGLSVELRSDFLFQFKRELTALAIGTEKSIILIVGHSYLVLEFPYLTPGVT
jgi:hypothetical protein